MVIRASLRAPRELVFEELPPVDSPAPTEIIGQTICSAVSIGTESAAYAGLAPLRPGPAYPRLVGYCNLARVIAAGAAVSRCRAGDRILTHQSHQSAFCCSEDDVLAVAPAGVDDASGALAYLAQLGLTALQRAETEAGQAVVVLGLGVIGLATVAVANALGATVTALGNDPVRLEAAQALGAASVQSTTHVDPDASGGALREFADVVVTTVNGWPAWRLALRVARPAGRIAVLGFPGRAQDPPTQNPFDSALFYDKQLTILACGLSGERLRPNLAWLLSEMEAGRLDLHPLVTDRRPYHDLRAVYERALRRDKRQIGVVLDWRGAPR